MPPFLIPPPHLLLYLTLMMSIPAANHKILPSLGLEGWGRSECRIENVPVEILIIELQEL